MTTTDVTDGRDVVLVPRTTMRGRSPKFRAALRAASARRAEARLKRQARGGDWRDGNDYTGESAFSPSAHAAEVNAATLRDIEHNRLGLAELDFNDRSYVDWSDYDSGGDRDSE